MARMQLRSVIGLYPSSEMQCWKLETEKAHAVSSDRSLPSVITRSVNAIGSEYIRPLTDDMSVATDTSNSNMKFTHVLPFFLLAAFALVDRVCLPLPSPTRNPCPCGFSSHVHGADSLCTAVYRRCCYPGHRPRRTSRHGPPPAFQLMSYTLLGLQPS